MCGWKIGGAKLKEKTAGFNKPAVLLYFLVNYIPLFLGLNPVESQDFVLVNLKRITIGNIQVEFEACVFECVPIAAIIQIDEVICLVFQIALFPDLSDKLSIAAQSKNQIVGLAGFQYQVTLEWVLIGFRELHETGTVLVAEIDIQFIVGVEEVDIKFTPAFRGLKLHPNAL